MGLAWKVFGWRQVGAPGGIDAGMRRRRVPHVMTLRHRRRLRRWFGWALVTVGAIGLVHPDVPGVVPLLIGVALLQLGSGRVRRLLRRVDEWWQGDRRFFLGLSPVLVTLSGRALVGEGGMLTRCCL